jgi:hypothetical protein
VLRLGGHLVTVWNVRHESVEWMTAYTDILDRHAGDTPRFRDMSWRRAINSNPQLAPVDEWRVVNPQLLDAEGAVDRALSTSFIAALSPERQADVADRVRELVEPLGPSFEFPYVSQLQAWRIV